MILRVIAIFAFILGAVSANAIEIVRYVAENGTGDGLSIDNPSGNLKSILELSYKVDRLIILAQPGTLEVPMIEEPDARPRYKNVYIYGGGVTDISNAKEKTIIKGDLEINGGTIVNVDFKGANYKNRFGYQMTGTLKTTACNVYYSNVSVLEYKTKPGDDNYISDVKANSLYINNPNGRYTHTFVNVYNTVVLSGKGLFLEGGVLGYFQYCDFYYNTRGAYLNCKEGTTFDDCRFVGNNTEGAVKIDVLTDDIAVYFNRCVFADNNSKERDCSSAITGISPYSLQNCLIMNNKSNSTARNNNAACWGAVQIHRSQTRISNCTFYKNGNGAIHYWMESADHANAPESQIFNCVFLGNGVPFVSYYSNNSPKMMYCAADFGSDIPELDAQNHNIRITEASAKMLVDENKYKVELQEGSPLINAGYLQFSSDMNHVSHLMFDGTDLGCVEYTGKWEKTTPENTLKIKNETFVKCKSVFNGSNYFAYIPSSITAEGDIVPYGALYTGDNLQQPKLYDDGRYVVTYMNIRGRKSALLSQYGSLNYWYILENLYYDNVAPIAKKVNNRWELQVPAATGKTSSTATKKSSTATTKKTGTTRRTTR